MFLFLFIWITTHKWFRTLIEFPNNHLFQHFDGGKSIMCMENGSYDEYDKLLEPL